MHTQIVCSIGPSTESDEMIKALIENGMDVARLNFSHDTLENHGERIDRIRKWSKKLGKKVKILCDLQGPKIRITEFEGDPIKVVEGTTVVFTTSVCGDIKPNEIVIVDEYLHSDLKAGDVMLIDDAQLEFVVEKIENHKIYAKVIRGGNIYPRKGVNVPLTQTTTSSLTEKDISDLRFILTKKPDWIALSFVQSKEDVINLRRLIGNNEIKIMTKLERATAINNLNEIIEEADGVMVARGDLGSELPFERLPIIQKQIIKTSNFLGKPVVTATQMLASMINAAFPTRAEVTDIANAVFDGTDAVMMSNETAIGKYPIEALQTMAKVVRQTEDFLHKENNL